ncbi:MAG: metallophosphoesterase [Candidatus Aenigmarchaeota archaeon]|jgi:putative SbcD/Mre11-related phosphoesterase|nr:metallophosphoesterase [Candidatus Aenigmarchaeota archaeon]
MEIFENVEIINGFKAVYIKELDLIVISDLQLGEELYLAEEKGIFVPQVQLKEIKKELSAIFRKIKAKRILINGDVKHEFGEASRQEWREVIELVEFLRKKVKEIIVVRGNHDNYLLNIASKIDLQVFDPFYLEKGYLFTHGHKKISYPENFHTLIIGHEEPAIILKEGFDKIKLPALLYGKMRNSKRIICLPAFSILSSGTEINASEIEDLLSPILKEDVDVDELEVIGIDKELGPLKFGKLKNIRI